MPHLIRKCFSPMRKWHLYSDYTNDVYIGETAHSYLFGWLVLSVCLCCSGVHQFYEPEYCAFGKRAKEVGVRKTVGSLRSQLIFQFFSESFLVVLISFLLACVAVATFLPWFNNLSAKEMEMPWNNLYFWLMSTAFIFITGLLAGSYPALYLSSFKPVNVLKGTFHAMVWLRFPGKHWWYCNSRFQWHLSSAPLWYPRVAVCQRASCGIYP